MFSVIAFNKFSKTEKEVCKYHNKLVAEIKAEWLNNTLPYNIGVKYKVE